MHNLLYILAVIIYSQNSLAMNCNPDFNLKSFHNDPKAYLEKGIIKLDHNCKTSSNSYFSETEIKTMAFVEAKDKLRKDFCHTNLKTGQSVCLKDIEPGKDVMVGKAPIESIDRAENLVTSDTLVTSILEMDSAYATGKVSGSPWSDWYWPIAVGQLSYRYSDTDMLTQFKDSGLDGKEAWPWMKSFHERNAPQNFVMNNNLSPAEKYDILVGDRNFTFTKTMLATGESYYNRDGYVDTWMGICHGWAAASYLLPRPQKTITVKSVDGVNVQFRPTDIKALASQLWAKGTKQKRFIGGRCNAKNPTKDPVTNRVLEQKCFDNNPGTWHLAVVNEVGIGKKAFVMDATYDYEVWNHPVISYSYSYFNPATLNESDLIDGDVIEKVGFANDKFKKYRTKTAVYIIGIKMEVKYLIETSPSKEDTDNEKNDAFNYAYYTYDLELDRNYNIIGGEWYTNKHPDFLWSPYHDSHARSYVDSYLPEKIDLNYLSKYDIRELAPHASKRQQPIGKIVEALIERSRL